MTSYINDATHHRYSDSVVSNGRKLLIAYFSVPLCDYYVCSLFIVCLLNATVSKKSHHLSDVL